MNRKGLREEKADAVIESYNQEAELLEKVIVHMEREKALIEAGDFVALCDCLAGRGEIVDEIARLEARRRELEAESSGFGLRQVRESLSSGESTLEVAEEARRRAVAAHRRAIKMDEELRETLKARKAELEKALTDLTQGRAANRAYNGQNGCSPPSVFLDKER
ncbi:MAG: flagellar protein FliT [Bacillota bacterium]